MFNSVSNSKISFYLRLISSFCVKFIYHINLIKCKILSHKLIKYFSILYTSLIDFVNSIKYRFKHAKQTLGLASMPLFVVCCVPMKFRSNCLILHFSLVQKSSSLWTTIYLSKNYKPNLVDSILMHRTVLLYSLKF